MGFVNDLNYDKIDQIDVSEIKTSIQSIHSLRVLENLDVFLSTMTIRPFVMWTLKMSDNDREPIVIDFLNLMANVSGVEIVMMIQFWVGIELYE